MRIASFLLSVIIVVSVVSCSKSSSTPAGNGYLRVLHGVPNLGAIEVRVNGTLAGTIGSYALSLPYYTIPAGGATVAIRQSGGADISTFTVNVSANSYATLVLADSLNKLKSSIVSENPVPASGKAKINVYHLSTVATDASFTLAGNGAVISANRVFNDQKVSPELAAYVETDPGAITFESRVPGTTGSTGIIGTSNQTLQAGKSYTFVFRNPVAPSSIPSLTFIGN